MILTHGSALQVPISELGGNGNGNGASVVDVRQSGDREEILRVLRETRGRVAGPDGAAARLGLKRTTLISRMKKLGIDTRKVS